MAKATPCGEYPERMDSSPTDSFEPEFEIDEEMKRILEERLKTLDEDMKTARPAKEVLAELRAELKESSIQRRKRGGR